MRTSSSTIGCLLASSLLVVGCEEPDSSGELAFADEETGTAESAITVQQAINSSCSTATVRGLSLQIIAKAGCIEPEAFTEIPNEPNLVIGDAVFPFLEKPARDALVAALQEKPGTTMTINSALRTVAQQLLLYRWYQNGQCNIGLAATPGNSNHETGLALDINQYSTWRPTLEAHGFKWFGSNDAVHFDYNGPGAVDYRGMDVLAFQTLWNDNNPGDLIDEDGVYGPQTEARLLSSPAEGFANPVMCDEPPGDRPDIFLGGSFDGASDVFVDGPSSGVVDLFESEKTRFTVAVTNQGAGAAGDVVLAIDLDAAWFDADGYAIEPADPAVSTLNPPQEGLGPRFDLHLGAVAAGAQKSVSIDVVPLVYSVDNAMTPNVRVFVAKVDDVYAQSAFGGEITNVDGSQTFGGGRLELAQATDVYSRSRWEWQSPRLEGASGTGGLTFSSSSTTLDLAGGTAGAAIAMPPSNLDGSALAKVHVRASRSGGEGEALLLVARDADDLEGAQTYPLDIPADGQSYEVTVPIGAGSIERIGIVPFTATPGSANLDYVRIEGASPQSSGEGGGDEGGGGEGGGDGDGFDDDVTGSCACDVPAGTSPGRGAALLLVALAALASRRRAKR